MTIQDLPPELFHLFLNYLNPHELRVCELVCRSWFSVIRSGPFWKNLCLKALRGNPDFISTFRMKRFWTRVQDSPFECKKFIFALLRLRSQWLTSSPNPTVNVIDCSIKDTRREWNRLYNYTGIYDMVWDPERCRLTFSVFDTIQVWDMIEVTPLKTLTSKTLDDENGRCQCFYPYADFLLCGTENGYIKVFNTMTESFLAKYRHKSNPISDIRIFDTIVMILDQYGSLQEWRICADDSSGRLEFIREIKIDTAYDDYSTRNVERLLDFNSDIILTSYRDRITVCHFNKGDEDCKDLILLSDNDVTRGKIVMCCSIFGTKGAVTVGKQCGWVDIYAPSKLDPPRYVLCGRYQTPFKDNITSISAFGEDRILFGDINAEIHACFVTESYEILPESKTFTLESGHNFGAFIWCIKSDASFIFSGDSNSRLVIHDFWPLKEDVKTTEKEKSLKKLKT